MAKIDKSQKIRMLLSIASEEWSFYPNQILTIGVEIEEQTAAAWIEVGHAELVQ